MDIDYTDIPFDGTTDRKQQTEEEILKLLEIYEENNFYNPPEK